MRYQLSRLAGRLGSDAVPEPMRLQRSLTKALPAHSQPSINLRVRGELRMILIALGISALAGWLDWSSWVSIPLGLFIFASVSQGQSFRAAQISPPVVIVVGSLIALGLMWAGRMLHGMVV